GCGRRRRSPPALPATRSPRRRAPGPTARLAPRRPRCSRPRRPRLPSARPGDRDIARGVSHAHPARCRIPDWRSPTRRGPARPTPELRALGLGEQRIHGGEPAARVGHGGLGRALVVSGAGAGLGTGTTSTPCASAATPLKFVAPRTRTRYLAPGASGWTTWTTSRS